MSDLHLLEDEATLYVLGRLTETGRGEFEARLAQSAELRALVRELEEGAVAVAMASPRRRVPQPVWARIEKAVAKETKPRVMDPSLWFGWLRNGWAAAAVCLAGWLLYALWADRANSPGVAPAPLVAEVNVESGGISSNSARTDASGTTPQPRNATNTERRSPQTISLALTREMVVLRSQKAELEKQVAHLSQVLTQQQALLSESSRLKFFQLGTASEGGMVATNSLPSPALQRALFLAMARELGWLPSPGNISPGSTQTNQGGVDFVDFHPGNNGTTSPPINLQSQTGQVPTDTTGSAAPSVVAGSGIPAVVVDDKVFVAFDPSSGVVPTGSDLSFWAGDSIQGFQSLGTAVMGNNVLVVGVTATSATPGGFLTVTATTPSGSSNVIGLLPLSGSTHP